MSIEARREFGLLLRQLQEGDTPSLPHSRPMPAIGKACHELRVNDRNKTWRLFYQIDDDAIVILDVAEKKTQQTPKTIIDVCQNRRKSYEETTRKKFKK
jgi:phage-related protein